jgi:hypothetical protein
MQFGKACPPTTEARCLAPGTCREDAISQGARRVHDGVAAYGGVAVLGGHMVAVRMATTELLREVSVMLLMVVNGGWPDMSVSRPMRLHPRPSFPVSLLQ